MNSFIDILSDKKKAKAGERPKGAPTANSYAFLAKNKQNSFEALRQPAELSEAAKRYTADPLRRLEAGTQRTLPNARPTVKGIMNDILIDADKERTAVPTTDYNSAEYGKAKAAYESAKRYTDQLKTGAARAGGGAYAQAITAAEERLAQTKAAFDTAEKNKNADIKTRDVNRRTGTLESLERDAAGSADFAATSVKSLADNYKIFQQTDRPYTEENEGEGFKPYLAFGIQKAPWAAFMTDKEKSTYAYWLAKDKNKAQEYWNALKPALNYRKQTDDNTLIENASEKYPAFGVAANITGSFLSPAALVGTAGHVVKDWVTGEETPVDPNSSAFGGAHMVNSSASGIKKNVETPLGGFLVDTGLSMAQFVSKLPLGAAALPLMASGAGGMTALEVTERGGTAEQALYMGLVSAAAEYFTEKISLDNLIGIYKAGGAGFRQGLKTAAINAARQGGVEFSEELLSEYINNIGDELIMGQASNMQAYVRELVSAGMSQEEALRKAAAQYWIINPLIAGAGGMLSGLAMGTGGSVAANISQAAQDSKAGKQMRSAFGQDYGEAVQELIATGQEYEQNSPAGYYADKAASRLAQGGELTDRQLGQLQRSNAQTQMQEAEAYFKGDKPQYMRRDADGQLIQPSFEEMHQWSLRELQNQQGKKLAESLKSFGVKNVVVENMPEGIDARWENGVVYLSSRLSTREAMNRKLGHEISHAADEGDGAFTADLISAMGEQGQNVDTLVEKKLATYKDFFRKQGNSSEWIEENITKRYAENEVAADYIGELLKNPKAIERLAGKPTLIQRLIAAIRSILGRNISQPEREGYEALAQALRAVAGAQGEVQTAESGNGVRYSVGKSGSSEPPLVLDDYQYPTEADALYSEEGSYIYDYDFLVNQKDMVAPIAPPLSSLKTDGKINPEFVVAVGLANAGNIGRLENGIATVTNTYTNSDLRISRGALRHGFDGASISRIRTNARIASIAGEIVKNAIPLNALENKNTQALGTYVMGSLVDSGDFNVVAIVTVQRHSGDVESMDFFDVVHSVSGRTAKKDGDNRSSTRETGSTPDTTISTVSIADFLDIVKNTHQSVLSDNVLKHYEMERNPQGFYSDKVRYAVYEKLTPEMAEDIIGGAQDEITTVRQMYQGGKTPSEIFNATGKVVMANGNIVSGIGGYIEGNVKEDGKTVTSGVDLGTGKLKSSTEEQGESSIFHGGRNTGDSGEHGRKTLPQWKALSTEKRKAITETVRQHSKTFSEEAKDLLNIGFNDSISDMAEAIYNDYALSPVAAEYKWKNFVGHIDDLISSFSKITEGNKVRYAIDEDGYMDALVGDYQQRQDRQLDRRAQAAMPKAELAGDPMEGTERFESLLEQLTPEEAKIARMVFKAAPSAEPKPDTYRQSTEYLDLLLSEAEEQESAAVQRAEQRKAKAEEKAAAAIKKSIGIIINKKHGGEETMELDAVREVLTGEDSRLLPEVDARDYEFANGMTGRGISYGKDLSRNLDAAAGKDTELRQALAELFERPLWRAKASYSKQVETRLNDLKRKMDELGIKAGSPESAAVQRYGEGQMQDQYGELHEYTLEHLKENFPDSWQDIVEAEKYCREVYDEYIDRMNRVLEEIYPNVIPKAQAEVTKFLGMAEFYRLQAAEQEKAEATTKKKLENKRAKLQRSKADKARAEIQNSINYQEKQLEAIQAAKEKYQALEAKYKNLAAIKQREIETGDVLKNKKLFKRKDYFHHFNEVERGFKGLVNIISTPADIDARLAGQSEFTKPKSKWASFMQQRGQGAYTEDAVGGLLKYIPAAEYKIAFDPIIAAGRQNIKGIAEATQESRAANDFLVWYGDFINDLAGKTNPFDRQWQKKFGRKFIATLRWLNSRVKSNAIMGSVRSAISQFFNLPNAAAYIKSPASWGRGIRLYSDYVMKRPAATETLNQSGFLRERYLDSAVNQFEEGIIKAPKKFANWMMSFGDEVVTKMIWSSAYEQGVKQGVKNPFEYADDITRRSVAGRGVGEVPLTQKSQVNQFFAPFQVEVNNTWQLLKERVGEKDALGLLLMFITSWIMNSVTRGLFGIDVSYDPINAAIEGAKEWNREDSLFLNLSKIPTRLLGETLSTVPGGAMLVEYVVPNESKRQELFGETDPTRFGTGNIGLNMIMRPIIAAATGKDFSNDLVSAVLNVGLPWGGRQTERIFDGLQDMGLIPRVSVSTEKGIQVHKQAGAASMTDNGKLRFPIKTDPFNVLRDMLMGPYSTREGKAYIDGGEKPWSEKKTEVYNELVMSGTDGNEAYRLIMQLENTQAKYVGRRSNSDPGTMVKSQAQARRDALISSGASGETKDIIYYGLLASDTEKEVMERLDRLGTEPGAASEILSKLAGIKTQPNISAAEQKRNAVLKWKASDEAKKELYISKISDSESTQKRIEVCEENGLSFDQFVEISDLYSKLNDSEKKVSQKAVSFISELTQRGYSSKQISALGEEFSFYSTMSNTGAIEDFNAMTAAGVSTENAASVLNRLAELKPPAGKATVQDDQKLRAVSNLSISENEKLAALAASVDKGTYQKIKLATEYGISIRSFIEFKDTLPKYDSDGNGSYKQNEVKAALGNMNLSNEQRAVLWQIQTRGKYNPYDQGVGTAAEDTLDSLKESGTGGGSVLAGNSYAFLVGGGEAAKDSTASVPAGNSYAFLVGK